MRRSDYVSASSVSAEDVLEILRDRYRHAEQLDPEAERGIELTFESSIAEWRESCDLLPFKDLWPALNAWFAVPFQALEWLEVLEPAELKTVGPVCELIASRATRPTIRPFPIAGIECWSAGTFLTIRSLLAQAGVPVQHIRPSSPLAGYAREYAAVFITEVGKLAPGVLPVPKIKHRAAHNVSVAALCLGFTILLFAFQWQVLFIASVILLVIGLGGVWSSSRYPPKAVRFGNLVTFRDLTEVVLQAKSR